METAATNAVDTGAATPESTQTLSGTDSAPVQTPAQEPKVENNANAEPEWFTKRIGEITAKYRSEERERMQLAQERDLLRQELQQFKTQAPKEEPTKTLEDFGYDDKKYQEYLFDRAEKRAVEAAKRVRIEEQTQAQKERTVRKFKEREAEFEKANPDYRDLAYSAPINDRVAELVMELETGPEIAHYLGKNKSVALALNDLPPHVAAIELGRIDAKLAHERAEKARALEAAKAAKAVSQAPPPAPKLDGGNAQVDKDPSQMSDAEFAKWRKRQIAQRR